MLEVGKQYQAYQAAYELELEEGNTQFPEETIHFCVLPKPKTVICDGQIEQLPHHLASDDWVAIKNLDTGRCRFLNVNSYEIKAIDDSRKGV